MKLKINKTLARELPALSEEQLADLKMSIKRDGVLSPVLYWVNEGKAEIIDGHNRHRIAQELGIKYKSVKLEFASIAKVQYWMHKTNSGRRGGQRDLKRMAELLAIVKDENAQAENIAPPTKTEIVQEVAQDAGVSESSVWRDTGKEEQPDKPQRQPKIVTPEEQSLSALKVIGQLIAKLTDEHKRIVKQMFDTAEPDPKSPA